mmetsp:Transcript_19408/g.35161  ORF Transcript_19408/g.35161 Transcript_19408/m.35161 type:complete len:199 (+) Transcript_19408:97-693(+)
MSRAQKVSNLDAAVSVRLPTRPYDGDDMLERPSVSTTRSSVGLASSVGSASDRGMSPRQALLRTSLQSALRSKGDNPQQPASTGFMLRSALSVASGSSAPSGSTVGGLGSPLPSPRPKKDRRNFDIEAEEVLKEDLIDWTKDVVRRSRGHVNKVSAVDAELLRLVDDEGAWTPTSAAARAKAQANGLGVATLAPDGWG